LINTEKPWRSGAKCGAAGICLVANAGGGQPRQPPLGGAPRNGSSAAKRTPSGARKRI